jgi:hypothetical protein
VPVGPKSQKYRRAERSRIGTTGQRQQIEWTIAALPIHSLKHAICGHSKRLGMQTRPENLINALFYSSRVRPSVQANSVQCSVEYWPFHDFHLALLWESIVTTAC